MRSWLGLLTIIISSPVVSHPHCTDEKSERETPKDLFPVGTGLERRRGWPEPLILLSNLAVSTPRRLLQEPFPGSPPRGTSHLLAYPDVHFSVPVAQHILITVTWTEVKLDYDLRK